MENWTFEEIADFCFCILLIIGSIAGIIFLWINWWSKW